MMLVIQLMLDLVVTNLLGGRFFSWKLNQAPGREVEEVGVDEGAPGEGLQLPSEALHGAGDVGVDHKLVGADEVAEGDYAGGSRLIHRPPYLDLHRGR